MSVQTTLEALTDQAKPLGVSKLADLSDLPAEDAERLLRAWPRVELGRRRRIVRELTDLAEDNVELNFDAVFLTALGDEDGEVRRGAIRGLWEYKGRDLIGLLLGMLAGDANAAVRAEAALALGRLVLQRELSGQHEAEGDRIGRALRATVNDTGEIVEVRGRALEAIGACSAAWVHDLIDRAYEGDDRRLRLSAVHAMGRNCDSRWLPTLIAELDSDDPEMRFEAAGACGSIADEEATPHLVRLLDDTDVEAQEAAIAALGEIGGAEAKEALRGLLEEGDERTREAALAALAVIDFEEDPLSLRVRDQRR